ncbi:hypothetical protein Glove_30g80 [Diversispora epigaea]|uniref:Pentacotripeptide-repeat region of PRORP domain-containing protein n=1 Tax=Diversispora epigaea TaxID=1348612 RepID=A0A397JIA0_9GLOM|nr:hypothetical protein Glove_30g80 [Diversispora epigaea]
MQRFLSRYQSCHYKTSLGFNISTHVTNPFITFTLAATPFLSTIRFWKSKFVINKPKRKKTRNISVRETHNLHSINVSELFMHKKDTRKKRHSTQQVPQNLTEASPLIWPKYLELSKKGELHSFTENDFVMVISKLLKSNWKQQRVFYWIERLCKEMDAIGLHLNKHLYEKIINIYVRFGDIARAESVFTEITQKNLVPTRGTYHILITRYAKLGKIRQCLELFQDMKKHLIMPDIKTYSTLILAYTRSNNIIGAYDLLDEMDRFNIKPNIITFNTIIHGLLNSHDFKGAEKCLDIMQNYGITPNVRTFNTLMAGYLDIKDFRSIEDIYNKMLKLKLEPCLDTYHILMTIFIQNEEPEKVKTIFEAIISHNMQVVRTFNILINMYTKIKDFDTARKTLERMQSLGLRPNVATYSTFISGYVNDQNLEESLKYFDEMIKRGIDPNLFIFNILLKGYLNSHGIQGAHKLISRMGEYNIIPNHVTYNIIMQYIKEKDYEDGFEKAMDQYHEMLSKDLNPTNRTFNIILGLATKKDIREHKFNSRLIRNDNKSGECPVENILKEMMNKKFVIDVITYLVLMGSFVNYQYLEGAEKLIQIMQHNGVSPNQFIFNILLDGYVKISDMNKAEFTIKRMLNNGFQKTTSVYNSLINGYASIGDIKAAYKEFEEMKRNNNEPDKISYTSLMDYFADNHQIRNVQKTFDYMCKQGIPHDIISYTVLAKAYALLGNIKGCWHVFIEMIKAGYEPDSVSTLIMLNAYNRKKDIKGAIKYLKEDCSGIEKLNTWHYNIILNMLARDKQRANGAFLLFMKMLYSQNQPSNSLDSSNSFNSSTSVQKINTTNLSIEFDKFDKSDGNDNNIANNIDPSPSSSSLFTDRELNIPLPDIDSVHIIINHFSRYQMWDYIIEIWDELYYREIYPRSIDYFIFMRAFSMKRQPEKMMKVWEKFILRNPPPDQFTRMINIIKEYVKARSIKT